MGDLRDVVYGLKTYLDKNPDAINDFTINARGHEKLNKFYRYCRAMRFYHLKRNCKWFFLLYRLVQLVTLFHLTGNFPVISSGLLSNNFFTAAIQLLVLNLVYCGGLIVFLLLHKDYHLRPLSKKLKHFFVLSTFERIYYKRLLTFYMPYAHRDFEMYEKHTWSYRFRAGVHDLFFAKRPSVIARKKRNESLRIQHEVQLPEDNVIDYEQARKRRVELSVRQNKRELTKFITNEREKDEQEQQQQESSQGDSASAPAEPKQEKEKKKVQTESDQKEHSGHDSSNDVGTKDPTS